VGEKYRIYHTQTFFPESLYIKELGRSPGLRLVIDLPIKKTVVLWINNKLYSLQLREQLWICEYTHQIPF